MRSLAAKIQSSAIVLQIFAFHNQSWQLNIFIQLKDNISDNQHPQQYLQLPFHDCVGFGLLTARMGDFIVK